MNRQDACSTTDEFSFLWAVAPSPPIKALLKIVQHLTFNRMQALREGINPPADYYNCGKISVSSNFSYNDLP